MKGSGVCACVGEKERTVDGCYRKRPVKSKEKGLATLDRVIHCAAEIITELSRSSFNASIEEKKKHKGIKADTDIHRHGGQAKSKEDKKDQYPKSFTESVISGIKLS